MTHGLFEEKVVLEKDSHIYRHINGDVYSGFNSVYEKISRPFFKGISRAVANNEGVTHLEVEQRWEAQTNEGTRIDEELTNYCISKTIKDEKLLPAIKQILEHYSDFKSTHEQIVVYSEEYKTATAIDKLCLYSNRKDGLVAISDYKCFEKMDLFSGTSWLKEPFNHLPDNKFIKTAFQLSYGAFHFEQLTGKKCKKLFIHMIQPSTIYEEKINQQIVQIPYLRNDVKILLDLHKEKSLTPESVF